MKKQTIRCVTGTDTARACGYKTGMAAEYKRDPPPASSVLSLSIHLFKFMLGPLKSPSRKKKNKKINTREQNIKRKFGLLQLLLPTDGSVTLWLVVALARWRDDFAHRLAAKEAIAVEATNLNTSRIRGDRFSFLFFLLPFKRQSARITFPIASFYQRWCFAFFFSYFQPSRSWNFVRVLLLSLSDCFSFLPSFQKNLMETLGSCVLLDNRKKIKSDAFQPFRPSSKHVRLNGAYLSARPPAESRLQAGQGWKFPLEWRGEIIRKAKS